jgi:RNA chaperone Hfq
METNLLDRMLSSYLADQTSVTVTLQNKIKVSGKIKAFDSYVIMMEKPKREILYRHAVASIALHLQEEVRPVPPAPRPALNSRPSPEKTQVRSTKPAAQKPRPQHPAAPAVAPAAPEQNVSTSMKEGLLRWMQEQKAAK